MKHNALKRSGYVALAVLLVLSSHTALAATMPAKGEPCSDYP